MNMLRAIFILVGAGFASALSHASPIRMDVFGPYMSFDADSRVLSVTGAAMARSEATIANPACSGLTFCITGFQTLTATIDTGGHLVGGAYTFVGSAPLLGLTADTLLLSATVQAVSIDVREGMNDPLYGAFWMNIVMAPIFADPLVGDIIGPVSLWGEMYYPTFVNGLGPLYGLPLTSANQWDHSWGVLRASDYSSISTAFAPIPEPSTLALLGAVCLGWRCRRFWTQARR